eukprot:CAMPEP_0171108162 /NCGR_PEP_ID=MMETSP0766_2-20121228/68312_1 /TAXON_ID=439317 /ORGANISM="Gambierdiscus australes, Strain CAWD 149" /LENGTH=259 /DNA_ID=CAMNT_0011569615 /DNA_START=59 /DNA_END=838 /DNA_ORIENTATION=+
MAAPQGVLLNPGLPGCRSRTAPQVRRHGGLLLAIFGGAAWASSLTWTGLASTQRCRTGSLRVTRAASEAQDAQARDVSEHSGGSGLGKRLRDRLADTLASQELQARTAVPAEEQKFIQRQDVDLNGIEPVSCLAGAVPVGVLSYGFWTFTGSFAAWCLEHPISTDFYPVQRLGVAFQTAVVGLSALAAGIFGFTALGLFLLGSRVAVGVALGELDASKESSDPPRRTTAERVKEVLTQDPVAVVMAARRATGRNVPNAD